MQKHFFTIFTEIYLVIFTRTDRLIQIISSWRIVILLLDLDYHRTIGLCLFGKNLIFCPVALQLVFVLPYFFRNKPFRIVR